MDATSGDTSDRFFPTLIVVLGVHAALIGVLWLISAHTKASPPEQITWLDGGGFAAPPAPSDPVPDLPSAPEPPAPPAAAPEPEPEDSSSDPLPTPPEPDELAQPKPTPTPTPAPKATPTPTPKPKTTPKPTATPKPKITRKPTPSPTLRKQVVKDKPKDTPKLAAAPKTSPAPTNTNSRETGSTSETSTGGNTGTPGGTKGGPGSPGGSANGKELQSYFATVGNCYRQHWNKPLTVVATGHDLSAIVRVRISAKGEVLSVTMQRPTGNREVDASIEAAFPKFKTVPPPPSGLLQNGVMEENMAIIYDL